jgi:hypothetical protein
MLRYTYIGCIVSKFGMKEGRLLLRNINLRYSDWHFWNTFGDIIIKLPFPAPNIATEVFVAFLRLSRQIGRIFT